jgi:holin-like protein
MMPGTIIDSSQRAVGSSAVARVARAARILAGVAILWSFASLGGVIVRALGAPIPGSVVGMLLMWLALEAGVVRLRWVQSGAAALLTVLGLLFVPAGAGFVQFTAAGTLWLEILAIVVIGCLISLAVSGHVSQLLLSRHD